MILILYMVLSLNDDGSWTPFGVASDDPTDCAAMLDQVRTIIPDRPLKCTAGEFTLKETMR